jgi:hypothetical protein
LVHLQNIHFAIRAIDIMLLFSFLFFLESWSKKQVQAKIFQAF